MLGTPEGHRQHPFRWRVGTPFLAPEVPSEVVREVASGWPLERVKKRLQPGLVRVGVLDVVHLIFDEDFLPGIHLHHSDFVDFSELFVASCPV